MSSPGLQPTERKDAIDASRLLATRYGQLLGWAKLLARGDMGKAEEIVQELFLYMALVRPDLNTIANLDGYLYTCLRNLYRSSLARASREALHLVRVEDFDSFAFAMSASTSGDILARQNDLRRICAYTTWRKESSKTASYFILHFFHGYGRQEVAELAKLPISAIYNKIKTARTEVKLYLDDPTKLRIVNRDTPPAPDLSWSLQSPLELFQELRQMILQSRRDACMSEQELLAHYRSSGGSPISCRLLAHIVSCEPCLSAIDRNARRPTLRDREPLDVFGFSSPSEGDDSVRGEVTLDAVLQSVRKKWARTYEHRPRTLFIALNGQVIAFHDVRSEHNRLSARIECSDRPQFVEVFSEQHVRLALLEVGPPPPEGAGASVQRVPLSDQRWLELGITFDGLGLQSEVAYFDSALASMVAEEQEETPLVLEADTGRTPRTQGLLDGLRIAGARWLANFRALIPTSALAWAVLLTVLAGGLGYFAYRNTQPPMDAAQILSDSIRVRNASLQGQTEHEVLRVEEISHDGEVLQQGVVVLWRDGDGNRYIRRLFDAQHRLIVTEWRNKDDKAVSHREAPSDGSAAGTSHSSMNQFWDQDLSAQAFAAMDDRAPQIRSVESGYELTRVGPTPAIPQLLSATLTLNRNLQAIRQTMRVHVGGEVRELRFEEADYEREPSRLVPDATFNPESGELSTRHRDSRSSTRHPHDLAGTTSTRLAELQIGVLYQLQAIQADTGVPIEVLRSSDDRVRVSGTVDTDALKNAIDNQLKILDGHDRLDLRIVSSRELAVPPGSRATARVEAYDVSQPGFAADSRIRAYLLARGLRGDALDAAVAQFSRDALQHAQLALQHAYALDRLATSLSPQELRSVTLSTQQEWTEMVNNHATKLEKELRSLRSEVEEISNTGDEPSAGKGEILALDDPEHFANAAGSLLRQVRDLNQQAGSFFASNGKLVRPENLDTALKTMIDTIPVKQAEEVAGFAERLSNSNGRRQNSAQR